MEQAVLEEMNHNHKRSHWPPFPLESFIWAQQSSPANWICLIKTWQMAGMLIAEIRMRDLRQCNFEGVCHKQFSQQLIRITRKVSKGLSVILCLLDHMRWGALMWWRMWLLKEIEKQRTNGEKAQKKKKKKIQEFKALQSKVLDICALNKTHKLTNACLGVAKHDIMVQVTWCWLILQRQQCLKLNLLDCERFVTVMSRKSPSLTLHHDHKEWSKWEQTLSAFLQQKNTRTLVQAHNTFENLTIKQVIED